MRADGIAACHVAAIAPGTVNDESSFATSLPSSDDENLTQDGVRSSRRLVGFPYLISVTWVLVKGPSRLSYSTAYRKRGQSCGCGSCTACPGGEGGGEQHGKSGHLRNWIFELKM